MLSGFELYPRWVPLLKITSDRGKPVFFFFHSRRQTKGKRTQMSYLVAVHLHDRCPSSISASKISKVTEN